MQTQTNTASKAGDGAEITPEMIEAGMNVLSDYDPIYDRMDQVVREIVCAALRVRLSPHR